MRVKYGETAQVLRRLLVSIRDVMASDANLASRLARIVSIIAKDMAAEACSVYIRRGDVLELVATQGLRASAVGRTRFRAGDGLIGEIAAKERPLAVPNAQIHPSFVYRAETGEEAYRALMGVPILRGGRVVGVLAVQNTAERQYTDAEIEALQTVAMVLAEMVASLIATPVAKSIAPPIPEQGIGLQFSLSHSGLIEISRRHGEEYNKPIITALLPRLQSLASRAIASFGSGGSNAFQYIIADAKEYLECLRNDPDNIPYAELWALGVQLQKHLDVSRRTINDRILPELEDNQQSALESLVALHGPFILATQVGEQLFDTAQRYSRSRQEQEQYIPLAVSLSQAVVKSESLVSKKVRKIFSNVHEDIGSSRHPEREMVTSETMTRNLLAAVGAVASFVGASIANGVISGVVGETNVGEQVISYGAKYADEATLLARSAAMFMLDNQDILKGLSALCAESLSWVSYFISWLKGQRL